jgi:hypothetical protein
MFSCNIKLLWFIDKRALAWKRLSKDCSIATKWNAGVWKLLRTC